MLKGWLCPQHEQVAFVIDLAHADRSPIDIHAENSLASWHLAHVVVGQLPRGVVGADNAKE